MNFEQYVKAIKGITAKYYKSNPGSHVIAHIEGENVDIIPTDAKTRREAWVENELYEMHQFTNDDYSIIVDDPKRKILVANFFDEFGSCYSGVALCSPDDKYDSDVGLAVAFAWALGRSIPDYI